MNESRATLQVAFLLLPDFPMLPTVAVLNALRVANRELGYQRYCWQLLSADGGPVCASDGLQLAVDAACEDAESMGTLLVCAAYDLHQPPSDSVMRWLRMQWRRGVRLVGVESGAQLLGRAGLLGEHAAAVHPEAQVSFRESLPRQPLFIGRYHAEVRLATIASPVAALDFVLEMIERDGGAPLAGQVAWILGHQRRDPHGRVLAPEPSEADGRAPLLQRCRGLMLANLESPLSITALCELLGVGERQLRRRFQRGIGVSPDAYYRALRLTEARFLLVYSDMPVTAVGLAVGYGELAAFSRAYQRHFGFPPSQRREPWRGLLPSPFMPERGE